MYAGVFERTHALQMEKGELMTTAMIETGEIEKRILTLSEQAMALIIKDNNDYIQAGEILKLHKGMEKHIKDYFKPLKEAAHVSWKGLCNAETTELEKLLPIETHLKNQIGRYQAEQERIRAEEEVRLRAEALRAEEERRLREALQAEAEGDKETAEEILNEQVFVPPPIVPVSTPKVSGISSAAIWKWELEDINKVPREYLKIDEVKINGVVRSMKSSCRIPGIKVYEDKQIRARG